MQDLFNEVFWEERWALQNYDYKFPVVGLVDYQRVLQRLADPEELYRGKRGSGFAVREQRRLASEAIPWPVVDKEGNKYALNPDTGLFEQAAVGVGSPGSKSKADWYGTDSITKPPVSPKTLPTRFLSAGLQPQKPVVVDFLNLYLKLQAFRRFGECDNDKDGHVRAWVVDQIEVRHPFMYQALVTGNLAYSAGDQHVYGMIRSEPGWDWWKWSHEGWT